MHHFQCESWPWMTSSACWFWAWQVWVPNFKKDWLGPQSVVVVIVNCRLGPTFNLFSCQRCYWLMMAFSFWLDRMFPLTAKANWALFSCLCSVIGICHFVICNITCIVILSLSFCHVVIRLFLSQVLCTKRQIQRQCRRVYWSCEILRRKSHLILNMFNPPVMGTQCTMLSGSMRDLKVNFKCNRQCPKQFGDKVKAWGVVNADYNDCEMCSWVLLCCVFILLTPWNVVAQQMQSLTHSQMLRQGWTWTCSGQSSVLRNH